jgi:hypothetical protein
MARRLKSLLRSRRTPFLVDTTPGGAREAVFPQAPTAGDGPLSWPDPWTETEPDREPGDLYFTGHPPGAVPAPPPSARVPASPRPPAEPWPARPTTTHAPTGWEWFAQWNFPTQLFLFSVVVAAGMWWLDRPEPKPPVADLAPVARPAAKPRPRLRPETFDWLYRLRETQVVTDQLEAEFAEAQQFYREYALDEFLDFDPWSLAADEVVTLTHFCDHGFFTVEREILVKILERKHLDHRPGASVAGGGATARLEAAALDRETRLASLREAAELYRRGRSSEVVLPGTLPPEEDQALRARLVDKLAAVRRERTRLDARIGELNALLR